MKKSLRLVMFAAVAFMLCFSSCTKDSEKLIVGKWKVVSARSSDIDNVSDDKGETWTFKENGAFEGHFSFLEGNGEGDGIGDAGDIECRYTCDGNTITLRGGDLEGTMHDYSYDYYTNYEFVFTFDIDEITSDVLSISGKVKGSMTDSEGYSESSMYKLSYELEKK